jgi:hypothetical protein
VWEGCLMGWGTEDFCSMQACLTQFLNPSQSSGRINHAKSLYAAGDVALWPHAVRKRAVVEICSVCKSGTLDLVSDDFIHNTRHIRAWGLHQPLPLAIGYPAWGPSPAGVAFAQNANPVYIHHHDEDYKIGLPAPAPR